LSLGGVHGLLKVKPWTTFDMVREKVFNRKGHQGNAEGHKGRHLDFKLVQT
jgi:hypothetical protein